MRRGHPWQMRGGKVATQEDMECWVRLVRECDQVLKGRGSAALVARAHRKASRAAVIGEPKSAENPCVQLVRAARRWTEAVGPTERAEAEANMGRYVEAVRARATAQVVAPVAPRFRADLDG